MRVGWFERIALKHVYYHMWNRSPVQVRWEGGARGSGWETHVHPWLNHVNVWQKPLQYCKVITLQLKKKIILEGVAIPFPRISSWPTDQTQISLIAGRFSTFWATREAPSHSGVMIFHRGKWTRERVGAFSDFSLLQYHNKWWQSLWRLQFWLIFDWLSSFRIT